MLSKLLFIGMLAGSAFDISTTEIALQYPGLVESNPLMRNRTVRIAVNIAVPIGIYKLTKDKPRKIQIAIAGSYIGLKTVVGFHNLSTINKHNKSKNVN